MIPNRLKTVILLGFLTGLFMAFGKALGGQQGMFIALIFAAIMNLVAYYFSASMVLAMYKAQPLDPQEYGWLYTIVEELAHTIKIPMPKLYLIPTPTPNAFATGRSPEHAAVAVTSGILSILDHQELRGVLAHELSHVKNRDILITTVAATLAGALGYLAEMARYSLFWGRSDSRDNQQTSVLGTIVLAMVIPFIASLLQLAISRSREYMADESGAQTCQDPLALASALEKIHTSVQSGKAMGYTTARAATASLFIMNPFRARDIMALLSTHPPMEERVARLKQIYQRMFNI